MEQREFIVEQETAGQRIDRFLSVKKLQHRMDMLSTKTM